MSVKENPREKALLHLAKHLESVLMDMHRCLHCGREVPPGFYFYCGTEHRKRYTYAFFHPNNSPLSRSDLQAGSGRKHWPKYNPPKSS